METIAQRVQRLMDLKGVTAYVVSQETGISSATMSRILTKEAKPNIKNSKTLADYFGVSVSYLHTGEDYNIQADTLGVNEPFELQYTENKNGSDFMKLENGQFLMTMPLAEWNVQAGLLDHYQDIEYVKEMAKHSIIVDEPYKGRYMAFRVKGDSMDDGTSNAITPNSVVATRELGRQHWTSKLRFKDFPYWIIYTTQNKMPLLKEITNHDTTTGVITCHSLNDSPEYNDFELSLNDVQALFYVVGITKEVSSKSYY